MDRRILLLSLSPLRPSPAGGSTCAPHPGSAVEWQGYARGRFRQGRADAAGPDHRRPCRARRQNRQGCAAVRPGRRRRSRRARSERRVNWRRPRNSSPIFRPAASRPKSNRRRPISPTPRRRATRRRPISRATQSLLKSGAPPRSSSIRSSADLRSGNAKVRGAGGDARPIARADGARGRDQGAAGGGRGGARRRSPWRAGGSTSAMSSRRSAASIADVLAQPGETLAAGAPVVSILPPENIFVRFFVPEPALVEPSSGRRSRDLLRRLPGRSRRRPSRSSRRRRNSRRRSSTANRRAANSSSRPRRGRRPSRRSLSIPASRSTVRPKAQGPPR